jgi:hypothetical protein
MGNEPITKTKEFRIYINQKFIFFRNLIFSSFLNINETKISVIYDDVLPKGTIIKKKQVTLDKTLTHLSKERKN